MLDEIHGEESQNSHRAWRDSWHQDSDLRAEMTATEETWGKQQAMAAGGDSQLLPFLSRVKLPRHPRSKTKQKHRDAPIQINQSTLN